MPITDRRTLLQAAAALPLVTAAATHGASREGPAAAPAAAAKPAPAKDVTRALAHYLVTANYDDLPANVRKEGVAHAAELGRRRDRRLASPDRRYRGLGARPVLRPAAGVAVRASRALRHHERGLHQRRVEPHLRLRRHASEDDHSSRRSGGLRDPRAVGNAAGLGQGLPQRAGARRRDRMPDRQRGLSEPLRCRLAHHRHGRRVRLGRRRRQAVEAERAADDVGARSCRLAAGGLARILRLDEQELQSGPRRVQRHLRRDAGLEEFHLAPTP